MVERYKESAELIASVDEEQSQLSLEFSFVQVDKENITLMMNEKGCYLIAAADDTDYVSALSFPAPVKPSEAKAIFQEGMLLVTVPFKEPLQNFIQVPIIESGSPEESA
jgi:HSP20 family protein